MNQVAGVPGVTEALFLARQLALAQEKNKSNETPMLYSCVLCGKGYRSDKAHAQHLNSRSHIMRAAQGTNNEDREKVIIKPLPRREVNKLPLKREATDEESVDSDDEWEEIDPEEELIDKAAKSFNDLNVGSAPNYRMEEDDDEYDFEELDPSCCFMCDLQHDTIENCMIHMHKQHGFFIPDVEYLKDPKGLLTYLGLKVLIFYSMFFLDINLFNQFTITGSWLHLYALSSHFFRSGGISCVCTAMIGVILLTAWKQLGSIWKQKVIAKYIMETAMMRKRLS